VPPNSAYHLAAGLLAVCAFLAFTPATRDSHEARLATNPRALGSTRFPFSPPRRHRPRRLVLPSIHRSFTRVTFAWARAGASDWFPAANARAASRPAAVTRDAPRARLHRCTRIPFGSRLPTRPVESSCLPLPPRRVRPVAGYPPAAPREAMIDGACRRACVTVGRGRDAAGGCRARWPGWLAPAACVVTRAKPVGVTELEWAWCAGLARPSLTAVDPMPSGISAGSHGNSKRDALHARLTRFD